MEKKTIFLVQPGVGKTYFCKHNLGWADLDLEFLWETQNFNAKTLLHYIDSFLTIGYNVVTGADPYVCNIIYSANKYDVKLIVADKQMKQEIINRVKNRGYQTNFTLTYEQSFDKWMRYFEQLEQPKIILHQGRYLSDILKSDGTIINTSI